MRALGTGVYWGVHVRATVQREAQLGSKYQLGCVGFEQTDISNFSNLIYPSPIKLPMSCDLLALYKPYILKIPCPSQKKGRKE